MPRSGRGGSSGPQTWTKFQNAPSRPPPHPATRVPKKGEVIHLRLHQISLEFLPALQPRPPFGLVQEGERRGEEQKQLTAWVTISLPKRPAQGEDGSHLITATAPGQSQLPPWRATHAGASGQPAQQSGTSRFTKVGRGEGWSACGLLTGFSP